MDRNIKDINLKLKRFAAGGLMVCLMMPSFTGTAWADIETEEYTGITKEYLLDMNVESLQEGIRYAISKDVRWSSKDMKFDSADEELLGRYEALFADSGENGPVYMVDDQFEKDMLPAGAKVSVLVRTDNQDKAVPVASPGNADQEAEVVKADVTGIATASEADGYSTATKANADRKKNEDYEITGNEEVILLFQNKSKDDYIFQIRAGGRLTRKIYVPSASIVFMMSELLIRGDFDSGSLTIRKELELGGGTIPEGTEFTYDVQITGIKNDAEVKLEGEPLSHEGGSISALVSVAPGESKTITGLTSGSRYTVTQTDGGILETLEEITVKGGVGETDIVDKTVTGVISGSASGTIQWDGSGWYDEDGTLVDLDAQLGSDFLWYDRNDNQVKTAELLRRMEEGGWNGKILFNASEGRIDAYKTEASFAYDAGGGMWYGVHKEITGRNYSSRSEEKNCNTEQEVEQFLGAHFIGWEDGTVGRRTARSYYWCWNVEPVKPTGDIGFGTIQHVEINYRGTLGPSLATLVLKKKLVNDATDTTPFTDGENQTFLYEIENADPGSVRFGEKFYTSITVERGQTEGTATLADIPASTRYVIREQKNMRYLPVDGDSQTVDTQESVTEIIFTGYKAHTGYFSDTNIIQSKVVPGENGIFSFAVHYPDGRPVHGLLSVAQPAAIMPESTKDSWTDYTRADLPLV